MSLNVLLIDDSPIVTQILLKQLTKVGHRVVQTNDPLDGISIFQSQKFNVVILDYNMPNINGFEVTKIIRKISKKVQILMLTTESLSKIGHKARNLGIDAWIPKDCKIEVIINALDLIEKRRIKK